MSASHAEKDESCMWRMAGSCLTSARRQQVDDWGTPEPSAASSSTASIGAAQQTGRPSAPLGLLINRPPAPAIFQAPAGALLFVAPGFTTPFSHHNERLANPVREQARP
jgi:hypothetical protein